MPPFAIQSTRVLTERGLEPAAVLVEGECIAGIARPGELDRATPVHDFGDAVVMPGLCDSHVHVNEPGRTEWEGFESATRAAAAGGVTALVDMPLNCIPVTTSARALETKLAATRDKLSVDVGFWGGVVPGNAGELEGLARAGALGCKAFLVHSGIDDFPNATESDLRDAMPVLRDAGLPLLAHAELDMGAPEGGDPRAYKTYLASRPRAWEDHAIELLIRLCRETRCPVHIVHLSSATAVPLLRAARDEGLPVTVETCPHYLCLSAEDVPDGATEYKCAPPIRERDNQDALWAALEEGVIDFVVSDHSPCTPALKHKDKGDFHDAWGGIASLELGLPSVSTHARARGIAIERLAEWLSERPARFAGLGASKGRLAPGFDADVVVWDPDARFTVDRSRLHFRHKLSPYLEKSLSGEIVCTYLRGRKIYDRGEFVASAAGRQLLGRG
jgi:allantoinase